MISERPARAARLLAAAIAAGLLALAAPARAENASGVPDPVAQALFQDGRDLVEKGDWAAGCTKFEASMLLYPAASTLLNIARCHEHAGKLASAWSTYKRALVLNKETIGDERKRAIDDLVAARLAALTPRIPKIKLVMTRKVPGVTLRSDGELIPSAVLGTEVPVDAGEHELEADAPGHVPFRIRYEVVEGASREIAIELVSEADAGAAIPTWAWVTGGVSLLSLGAAAVFRIDQAYIEGYQSARCHGDVQSGCPSSYRPGPDNDRKNVDFGLSLGLGIAGAVALSASVVGIALGARAARAPKTAIIVTPQGAALAASFRF